MSETGCHGNHVSQIVGNIAGLKGENVNLHIHEICLSLINIIELEGLGQRPPTTLHLVHDDGICLVP